MPVNKERIRLWVDALRSGGFQQTTGALERAIASPGYSEGSCCLGVACRVAMNNGLPVRVTTFGGSVNLFDGESAYLPAGVADWFGVADRSPTVGGKSLTILNDEESWTFSQIADAIEKEYLT